MSPLKKARKQAAAQTESAVDQAVAFIQPYVAAAEDKAHVAAKYASDHSKALAEQSKVLAEQSKLLADKAKDNLGEALEKVAPVVDDAKHRVQHDVVPKLKDLIDHASESEVVKTATQRGSAALAAVKGDLALPVPTKKKKSRKVVKVLGITALIAGAVVAVRKFLTSKESDWTAHQPSTGYTPTPKAETLLNDQTRPATPTASPAAKPATPAAAAAKPAEPASQKRPGSESASTVEAAATSASTLADEATAENQAGADPQSAGEVVSDTDTQTKPAYGEGSHVGENPPEGYTIKGNERSMKYHVPESGGYDRTIADVWFDSEERATAAGFTRAQR